MIAKKLGTSLQLEMIPEEDISRSKRKTYAFCPSKKTENGAYYAHSAKNYFACHVPKRFVQNVLTIVVLPL
jgi:hypothetical protein